MGKYEKVFCFSSQRPRRQDCGRKGVTVGAQREPGAISKDTFFYSASLELLLCIWSGSARLAPLQSGPFLAFRSHSILEGQPCVLSPRAQLFKRIVDGSLQY